MQAILAEIHVEQAVFYRLAQAQRDDNAATLYNISVDLGKLEGRIKEWLGELGN